MYVIDGRDIRKGYAIFSVVSVRLEGTGMRLIAAAAMCVALLTAIARAAISADCGAPAAMPDVWEVSTSAQQGLDPKLICATGPSLAKLTGADPHGVVVARRGVLVYEQYFAGGDMRGSTWIGVVPHDANTLHNTGSITKGVIALLVGIALDGGLLKNLDAPIFSVLPEYRDLRTPDNSRSTIRQRGIIRASRDAGLGVGTLPER